MMVFLGFGLSEAGDLELLMSFKRSLPNPQVLQNWDPSQNSCSFVGVNYKASHVTGAALQSLSLSVNFRSISSHLLTLGILKRLSLRFVNLTGDISTAAFQCGSQLAVLDLSGNGLRGVVVDVFNLTATCSRLRSLNLSGNSFRIPPVGKSASVSGGFSVEVLDLSYNKISREADLRWLLSSLSILWGLDLTGNRLTSGIPVMSDCFGLQHLDLSANDLTST